MVGEVGWPMHANPLRPVMSDLSSVARRVHAPELGMERARTEGPVRAAVRRLNSSG